MLPHVMLAVRRVAAGVRRIAGMPDYHGYVAHVTRCNSERRVLTEREFFEEFLRARYNDGPTRCC